MVQCLLCQLISRVRCAVSAMHVRNTILNNHYHKDSFTIVGKTQSGRSLRGF